MIITSTQPSTRNLSLVLGLIIGGGIGNMIDRVWRGGAVDFIYLGIGPRFNTADLFIATGVVALVAREIVLLYRRTRY
jgi:signal peptidase II